MFCQSSFSSSLSFTALVFVTNIVPRTSHTLLSLYVGKQKQTICKERENKRPSYDFSFLSFLWSLREDNFLFHKVLFSWNLNVYVLLTYILVNVIIVSILLTSTVFPISIIFHKNVLLYIWMLKSQSLQGHKEILWTKYTKGCEEVHDEI